MLDIAIGMKDVVYKASCVFLAAHRIGICIYSNQLEKQFDFCINTVYKFLIKITMS